VKSTAQISLNPTTHAKHPHRKCERERERERDTNTTITQPRNVMVSIHLLHNTDIFTHYKNGLSEQEHIITKFCNPRRLKMCDCVWSSKHRGTTYWLFVITFKAHINALFCM